MNMRKAKLKRGNLFYEKEMRQLVGHGYFMQKQFAKALPLPGGLCSKSRKSDNREDIYEVSYCYYQRR